MIVQAGRNEAVSVGGTCGQRQRCARVVNSGLIKPRSPQNVYLCLMQAAQQGLLAKCFQGADPKKLLGLSFILAVSLIWVIASFVVATIEGQGASPVVLTLVANSLFAVYVPIYFLNLRLRKHWSQRAAQQAALQQQNGLELEQETLVPARRPRSDGYAVSPMASPRSQGGAGGGVAAEDSSNSVHKAAAAALPGMPLKQLFRAALLVSAQRYKCGRAAALYVCCRGQAPLPVGCCMGLRCMPCLNPTALPILPRARLPTNHDQVAPLWFLAQLTFNLSLSRTSVTSNTILSSTSALFTFLLAVALLSEAFTLTKMAFIMLVIAGERAGVERRLRAVGVGWGGRTDLGWVG